MRESSEMDAIEFWIWEHATKYGMTKVLRKIKSNFSQVVVPNSWLSARYLHQIKNDWSKLNSQISPKELNALKQTLTSTFKHYIKDLKHVIKISDCIRLDLGCKAAFLVMRSAESKPAVKLQVMEKIFPCWNMNIWTKMKESFGLKDDLIMEEMKQFYLEMRLKTCKVDCEKEILDQFREMMKKHFPSLISFMQKIKLSRLERIQLNKMRLLDKQFEFLRVRLNCGLVNELVVLDLLEDVQRKKSIESASKSLKEAKLYEPTTDDSKEIILYTLPPDPKFKSSDNQFYPACFLNNPFMSTHMAVDNDGILEEMIVNRNIPRKPDGKDFGPLWFSDTRLVIKTEKNELSIDRDCLKETKDVSVALSTYDESISDHFVKTSSAAADEFANKKQLNSNAVEEEPTKRAVDQDNSTDFVNDDPQLVSEVPNSTIGTELVHSIQSWIDNNPPKSPSSMENCSPHSKEKLSFPSEFIENCVLPENSKIPFEKIVRSEPVFSILNFSSLEENSNSEEVCLKFNAHEWIKPDGVLNEYESSERFIPSSDIEYVSSTTASTSSCRRIQTRSRYKYLTEFENSRKRKEVEKRRSNENGDDSSSSNYRFQRRLRSQSRNSNSEPLSVRTTRSKRKTRKLSTSSSSSGYSPRSKILQLEAPAPTVNKSIFSIDSISEESSTEQQKIRLAGGWSGTPPIDEEPSNYHTPPQQNSKCSEETALELSALRTGIKRKLLEEEQPVSDNPKSKRVQVKDLSAGKRDLVNAVETLQKHSEKLRISNPIFSGHCEKLDLCIQRILRSHHKVSKKGNDSEG